ncbi:hypothetical protein [Paenibacillus polymyxa]|uniref:Uncharacterized protein n=1 Tax=Paenibacillus polymyxa TaxID=1406 RepID=A0AAP3ZWW1_PAEPO|nr:hypothetical protein [Paenibacillus polymyxa]MDH2331030.1 hypothetical protein [Paenibacillus polymyxa]
MMRQDMDFRKVLILIYIQTYEVIIDINEIIDLTGINYIIVKELIFELNYDQYIYYDESLRVYKMTRLGREFLHSHYLNKIKLEDLQTASLGPDSTKKFHIFIPKNFHRRFK